MHLHRVHRHMKLNEIEETDKDDHGMITSLRLQLLFSRVEGMAAL